MRQEAPLGKWSRCLCGQRQTAPRAGAWRSPAGAARGATVTAVTLAQRCASGSSAKAFAGRKVNRGRSVAGSSAGRRPSRDRVC